MTLQAPSKKEQGQPHHAGDVLHNVVIQGWAVDLSCCPAVGWVCEQGGREEQPAQGWMPREGLGCLSSWEPPRTHSSMQGGTPVGWEKPSGI